MKFDFYLKRKRLTLKQFVSRNDIDSYEELISFLADSGVNYPIYEEVKHVFETPVVEKRPADKRSSVGNKQPTKRSNSNSTRGSKAGTGKSASTRRRGRRKKASDKVEPVQRDSKAGSDK